jgi:GT2 family glycosyltransferase
MVCVVTINYNLSAETIPCVDSVLASLYDDFKIFLIDNGSKQDDYTNLLNKFATNAKVQVLRIENNCGYVGGVNFGLKAAMEINPDYYMVMNNDTILDKDAIGHLVSAAMRYDDRAIISGKVYYYDHPDILQHTGEMITDHRYINAIAPGRNEKDIGQFDEEAERDALDDVFWLLPAGIVHDVGLYCEYFFLYAEQGDYAMRARRKGYKQIFTPKAKIWHKVSMTSGGGDTRALRILYWRGQGTFVFQYRNLKTKYFIIIMLKTFAIHISKAVLKKGDDRKCSLAWLRGYFRGFRWMFNKKPNNGYNPYIQ